MANADWVRLEGSEPQRPAGAQRVQDIDPELAIRVTVVVRGRDDAGLARTVEELTGTPPAERRYVSRTELGERYGADPEDLRRVADFYRDRGLEVVERSVPRRAVVLTGPVRLVGPAFGVGFGTYRHPAGTYRGLDGPVSLPPDLAGVATAVLGLEDRPQASARHVLAPAGAAPGFSPRTVGEIYAFPTPSGTVTQRAGIIELGGGYTQSDLDAFFSTGGIAAPTVVAVSVDGAPNSPTGGTGADVEVTLDIEVIGALAPGMRIAAYFAPNTDQGFYDAVTTAVHDQQNAPAVLSISWGEAESAWSAQAMTQMEQAFQQAAAAGITVCVAAGDSGSSDGVGDGLAHVDFPASAPHALACGGTTLHAQGTAREGETVWDSGGGATGGGISAQFPVPSWQASAQVPPSANPGGETGRGVPDVAGDADPSTGYAIYGGGATQTVGGTSAVAPLWAGLVALCNQALGHDLGFLGAHIYPLLGQAAFHDITSGSNGSYQAGPGWDACTGLGTPDGTALLQALRGA